MIVKRRYLFVRVAYSTGWRRRWLGRAILPLNPDIRTERGILTTAMQMINNDMYRRGVMSWDLVKVDIQAHAVADGDPILSLQTDGLTEVSPGLRMFWIELHAPEEATMEP